MKKYLVLVFVFVCLLAFTSSSFAAVNLKGGTYLRSRYEYWKNIGDMNSDTLDNRSFFRFKASLWGKADFDKNTSLYGKLSDEFRAHTYFGGTSAAYRDKTASKKGYHFNINEVFVENLYLDLKDFLKMPLDLRIGRQDLVGQYGENFLIADGTPGDGGRSVYFNAAKASWRIDKNNTLDTIYINDPRDEEFLPIINRDKLVYASNPTRDKVSQSLANTDEAGAVVYLKNKAIKDLYLEPYYIYKYEAEEGGLGYQAQKSRINTIGSFVKYNFAPWAVRTQLAGQFGDYGTNDREAMGGYVFLDRDFKATFSPKASLGYIYLSGDKSSTTKNEGWDPLFNRTPWISDLYIQAIANESSIPAYWTNLQAVRTQLALTLTKKAKLTLWYNYLRANANVPASTVLSGKSKERGHLPQVKLDYIFNKNISSYIQLEYFIPGDFYVEKDNAIFLRTELTLQF